MGPADGLGADRGAVAIGLIHDPAAPGDTATALAALELHTPDDVPIVVLGATGGSDGAAVDAEAAGRERLLLAPGDHRDLAGLITAFDRLAAPADVVLIASGCRPPAGWLDRLRAAAAGDTTVATVTPLGDGGGTLDVGGDSVPDPDETIARVALGTRPRLLVGGPHCIYVCRSAVELLGGWPQVAAGIEDLPTAGLERLIAALSRACVAAGLVNIVADDLYVGARGRDLAAGPPSAAPDRLAEIDRRDERSALQRTVALSRAALSRLSVTVDARSLGPRVGGTQLYTLELALALAQTGDVTVRVVVAADVGPVARARLADAGGIEIITYEEAVAGVALSDIVHRPQQVFSVGDLNLLRLLGRRVVVTHQDLIAYHNPTYHPSLDAWEQYRRVTRIALTAADLAVFFSEHSRRDALAEDLGAPGRCAVIGAALGAPSSAPPRAPAGAPADREFIVCLGPDYRHKNRRFAIELLGALRAGQDWSGLLVFAGSHVADGSSAVEEQQLLAADEDLRRSVIDLGGIDDPEREWLFANARAVLVPSVIEGFGLVPLEAARAGRPCLFAPVSSLPEVVSAELATLVPWDAVRSAAAVAPLLRDGPQRRDHIAGLREQAGRWNWSEVAAELVSAYRATLRTPYRAAATHAWQELERERYLVEVEDSRQEMSRIHAELLGHLGDRIALASDEGFLTPRQQRGLLRIGARPALARVVLWPFAVLGSIRTARARRDG